MEVGADSALAARYAGRALPLPYPGTWWWPRGQSAGLENAGKRSTESIIVDKENEVNAFPLK